MSSLQELCTKKINLMLKNSTDTYFDIENLSDQLFPKLIDECETTATNVVLKGRFFGEKRSLQPWNPVSSNFIEPNSNPIFTIFLKPRFEETDEYIYLRWDDVKNLEWWAEFHYFKRNPQKSILKGRNVPVDTKLTSFDEENGTFRFDSKIYSWFYAQVTFN